MSLILKNSVILFGHQKYLIPLSKKFHVLSVKSEYKSDKKVYIKNVRHFGKKQIPGVVKSPLGKVNVPMVSLPQYVWKNWEKFEDEPAAVSKTTNTIYYKKTELL